MNFAKELKRFEKMQKEMQELQRKQQAICPHVSKKGKPWIQEIHTGEDIRKGRCRKCGAVIIIDEEVLSADALRLNVEIMQSALAELRAAAVNGKINLDDKILRLIQQFGSEILPELPETMEALHTIVSKRKGKKKNKKDKKKNKKKNVRRRHY